jgi:hypothetical protein
MSATLQAQWAWVVFATEYLLDDAAHPVTATFCIGIANNLEDAEAVAVAHLATHTSEGAPWYGPPAAWVPEEPAGRSIKRSGSKPHALMCHLGERKARCVNEWSSRTAYHAEWHRVGTVRR